MNDEPAEVTSFRRYLKRRAYAPNTIRCYLNDVAHFLQFVAQPVGQVTPQDVDRYIEAQQERGLAATTIDRVVYLTTADKSFGCVQNKLKI